jgi:hypothetical protein
MILILYVGLYYINYTYGNSPLTTIGFGLHEDNNTNPIIQISCKGLYPELFIGSRVSCTYSKPINATNSIVHFTTLYGEETTYNLTDLSFVIPSKTVKIGIELWVNDSVHYPAGYYWGANQTRLFTEEEVLKNRENFITYLIALIGLVFITVPGMVLNFGNLSQNKDNLTNKPSSPKSPKPK